MGGDGGDYSGEPLVWESCLWGFMSATSLMIGASIGVTCLPRKQVRAALMSFGGGALLFALSIELFGHALHRFEESGESLPLWMMFAASVLGGLLFAGLNKVLNEHGAAVRKSSTWRSRFQALRSLMARRLANRLLQVQIFAELEVREVVELIQTAMYKEHYNAGDIIMSQETRNSGLFFIISGVVRLQLSEDGGGDLSASLKRPKRNGTLALFNFGRAWSGVDGDGGGECPSPGILDVFKRSRSEPASPRPNAKPEPSPRRKLSGQLQASPGPSREASPSKAGDQSPTWDLGPDKVFGDMALLSGMHCGMVAVALESTKVLRIPGHEVMRLVDRSAKVRNYVSRRGIENLRQIDMLKALPDTTAEVLAEKCPLVTFQPGQLVFKGQVDEKSAIISVIFGAIEVKRGASDTGRTVNVNNLLCTEHLLGEVSQPFVAHALEPTSVLMIERQRLAGLLPTVPAAPMAAGAPGEDLALVDVDITTPAEVSKGGPQAAAVGTHVMPCLALPGEMDGADKDSISSTGVSPEVVGSRACDQDKLRGAASPPLELEASTRPSRRERLKTMGRDLGWDGEDDDGGGALARMPDIRRSSRRLTSSKVRVRGSVMPRSETLIDEIAGLVTDGDMHEKDGGIARVDSKWSTMSQHGGGDQAPSSDHGHGGAHGSGSAHAAIMVWLGILIDAVPESLVIGILINKSAEDGERGFKQSAATALPFVIGVFISNLPESMSSSGSMLAHGVGRTKILLMWAGTTVVTAVGAALGALLFPPGSSGDLHVESAIAAVEGLAAGAMLTMIAQTMMPEAFEQGGDVVGLSTLAGFLCALSVKLLPLD